MKRLKQQVQQHLQQNTEQTFYSRTNTGKKFIPFYEERDHIGRLIKNPSSPKYCYEMNFTQQQNLNYSRQRTSRQDRFIDQNMIKYFKNDTISHKSSPSRHKAHKKTIISLISQSLPAKTSIKFKPSNLAPKKQQLLRPFTQSANLIKIQSLNMPKNTKNDNNTLKRSISTTLSRNPRENIYVYSQSLMKKPFYNQFKLKKNYNEDKFAEVSRVKKKMQLQVKLQQDFQQKHGQFLNKIMKSKQLAFEVRVGLDKLDDYY